MLVRQNRSARMKPTPTYDSAAQLPEHRMIAESPHESERTARRQRRHAFAFALVTLPAMRCATAGAPCKNDGAAQRQERHAKNDDAARRQERHAITEAPFAQPPVACRNSGQLFEVCNPFPALFFASCQFSEVCNPFSNNLGTRLPLLAFRPCIRKDVTRRFRNQHDAPPLLDALRTPSTPKNIVQRITYWSCGRILDRASRGRRALCTAGNSRRGRWRTSPRAG